MKWALKRIELFAPTGAPHTEAGRENLHSDAKKPALKKDTPLRMAVRGGCGCGGYRAVRIARCVPARYMAALRWMMLGRDVTVGHHR